MCRCLYELAVAMHSSAPSFISSIFDVSCTACCIWSVISAISNPSFPGLFCHVPLKRDQWDWDLWMRLNDTLNAIGCTFKFWPLDSDYVANQHVAYGAVASIYVLFACMHVHCSMFAVSCTFEFWPLNSDYGADENKVNDLPSMCCFMHSLFHLECNFFSLKSQSLLPRSVTTFRKNRPMKLKTNSDLELNCKW